MSVWDLTVKSSQYGNRNNVLHIVWKLDLQLPMQSVPITTNVVSSNPAHGEVYLIQRYVIKFVSDLRQVLRFPPPIKLTDTI